MILFFIKIMAQNYRQNFFFYFLSMLFSSTTNNNIHILDQNYLITHCFIHYNHNFDYLHIVDNLS
jgi:hypothetical protein